MGGDDWTIVASGSSSPDSGIYLPPPTVSFLENRRSTSELLDFLGVRMELVATDVNEPLLDGCLLASFASGPCSDSQLAEVLDTGGRCAGDRGPMGLGGMAENVVNPLMEVLRVCVGRSENVG